MMLFAMLEGVVRENHHVGGEMCILAPSENEAQANTSERSKISHAIMHKANACRSLNGQMHNLVVE